MNLMKSTIPSDQVLWDLWLSRYQLAVLTVAFEIGFFEAFQKKASTISKLAKQLTLGERTVEIFANIFVHLGFLRKSKKLYQLTTTAKTYLLLSSPLYWGAQLEGLCQRAEHKQILDVIREGNYHLTHDGKTISSMWEEGNITPKAASNFTQSMHATIFASAIKAIKSGLFKSTKNLLDIGGGSGCFSIAYINQYPNYKATVFELPAVAEVTNTYLTEYKVDNKVAVHTGNFFKDPWPTGHDGILFSQIFHDWSRAYAEKLAKSAYASLPSGGKIYIYEMLLDNSRTAPLTTALFDLLMFMNHRSQQFTKKELINLLQKVGFKNVKVKNIFGYFSLVIAVK